MTKTINIANDIDRPLYGQKYFNVSLFNPQSLVEDKNIYKFRKFITQLLKDINNFLENQHQLNSQSLQGQQDLISEKIIRELNPTTEQNAFAQKVLDLCIKHTDDHIKNYVQSTIKENIKSLKANYDYLDDPNKLNEAYQFFCDQNFQQLENECQKNQITSTPMFKFRGAFEDYQEATDYAKKIAEDSPYFPIYTGESGKWIPSIVGTSAVQDTIYDNDELNALFSQYKKSQDKKNIDFQNYVKEIQGNRNKKSKEERQEVNSKLEAADLMNHENIKKQT